MPSCHLTHFRHQFFPRRGAFLFKEGQPSEGQSLNLGHLSRLGEPLSDSESPQDEIVAPSSEADDLDSIAPEQPVAPEAESRQEKIVKETQRGLDRTRDRLENEVFTDEEERERFEKTIKEAIEALESDKLREFIEKHKAYNADYLQWNQDFCDLLGLKTAEGKALSHPERRKFVAAAQLYLGSHFQDRSKDIFRVRKKDINPFTYIDGRMGAYTVSVLAAYWNEKNPEDKRGLVGYSGLGEVFGKKGDNQTVYGEALDYLKNQLKGIPPSAVVAPVTEAQAAPEVAASAPELASTATPLSDDNRRAISRIVTQWSESKWKHYEEGGNKKREAELLDEAGHFKKETTAEEFDVDVIDDEYTRPGSWPRQAYALYANALKDWRSKQAYYDSNRIDSNPALSEETRGAKKLELESAIQARDQALSDLTDSIRAYFAAEHEAHEIADLEFSEKLSTEAGKYDFPTGNLADLISPTSINTMESKMPISLFTLKAYLKELPFRTFKDLAEAERTAKNPEAWIQLGALFARAGLKANDILPTLNHAIHLSNLRKYSGIQYALLQGELRKASPIERRIREIRTANDSIPLADALRKYRTKPPLVARAD